MPASNRIRVLVASQDSLTRAGLTALISDLPELLLSGQTGDLDALPAETELYEPDVVVLDISQAPDRLTILHDFSVPVIAIVPDDESAAAAWGIGARGILPRDVKPARLAAAIKAVAEGLTAIDIRFADVLASSSGRMPPAPVETLTERELQVLQLVAEGLPNKSIASELGISEHTVKFHVNSILGKMGAQSRTQAVTFATRLGLIKL